MERFEEIKEALVRYLQASPLLEGTRVRGEYANLRREFPLKQPWLVVGLSSARVSPAGMGGFLGEDPSGAEQGVFGSKIKLTLRFDLLVPAESGGARCPLLYEALCQLLILEPAPFPFEEMECGQVTYDPEGRAYSMTALASFTAGFVRRERMARISEFQVVRRED